MILRVLGWDFDRKVETVQDFGTVNASDRSISRTLGVMRDVVAREFSGLAAVMIAAELREKSRGREVEGLFRLLRTRQKFVPDPADIELLKTPGWMVQRFFRSGRFEGDCDDIAMLGAAVLKNLGYQPVFVVVSRTPRVKGGRFEHVHFGYTKDRKRPPTMNNVVPLDPQENHIAGVWRSGDIARIRIEIA